MEKIELNGKTADGFKVDFVRSTLLLIRAEKGFLGCGYFNLDAAEKLGEAAAVVTGVKNYDDMLNAKVIKMSSAAAALGVEIGMDGRNALLKMF